MVSANIGTIRNREAHRRGAAGASEPLPLARAPRIRKGAAESVRAFVETAGGAFPQAVQTEIEQISRRGATPLVVASNRITLGVIELKDVVKGGIKPEETAQRFAQINDFERLLVESGTVVLKFLLHISKEEQRERLQDRLDDPAKHWKFAVGDLEERTRWDAYQAAYGEAVGATGTPWAP